MSVLLAACLASAERVARPPDQDPRKILTPHIAWGKPLAGGPIRVLAIVRSGSSREVYELAQRLDIQFDLVTLYHGHQWHPEESFCENLDRVAEFMAKKPDVFLVGGIQTQAMPMDLHYQMLQQVAEGAGLVCVNAEPWQGLGPAQSKLKERPVGWFADTLPAVPYSMFRRVVLTELKQFKVYTQGGVVTRYREIPWPVGTEGLCYQVGKGRVASVSGHNFQGPYLQGSPSALPATETPPDRPTMHEYLYAMMAKAVRWAANRAPQVQLTGLQQEGGRVPAMHSDLRNHAAYVNEGQSWSGTARAVVRDRWGDVLQSRDTAVTLPPGRGVITLQLTTPRLPAGDHTMDCWLVDTEKRVVDWGSLAITAASTTGVAVEMSALSFEPDKPIEATVAISDHNPKSQYEVAAQIRDGDGRILARQEAPVPGGALSARVSLRLPRPNGLVYYLEASLIEAIQNLRRPIAYDLAKFTVPNLPRDEYYVSANDSRQMTHLSWLRTKMSQRHGVDCKRGYGFHILGEVGTAYQGQSPAPFFSHVGGCGFLGVPARCLSAPEYRQQLMDGMKHLAEQVKPYGASCYNLGDDTGVCEALCKQPGCFERFVEAMRKKYGSVGSLNKVWGTKLRRLEDVTVDFIGSEQVAQNYGPWFDYLYWHEDLYCETFKRCNDIVRAVDPNAWVGQDASGYANVIDLYLEGCTYVAPYFRRVLAKKMGCFQKRPGFYGACTGTYRGDGRDPNNQCIPWDLVFAGNNAILFWSMTCGNGGDLTLHPRGYQMEEIRELKGGIANLFIRATRQDDGVLLYHSRASKHATGIENRIGYQDLCESNFSTMVEDLGLQARWTTTKRAEGGEISRLKPRVVILPYCQALSDKEIEALERFVRDGGTLLADARPAVYTYNGRPRDVGGLDAVFGIKRTPMKDYTAQGDLVMKAALGALAPGQVVTRTIVDKSVSATTGKPLAELSGAPAVLVNRHGKGTAILLNFFVGRYEGLLDAGQADALRALYRGLLEQAGCKRLIIATTGGQDAPGVELVRFVNGPVTLLGVAKRALACEKYPMTVNLKLPAASHVYDLRAGSYLGNTDQLKAEVGPMGRKAFALVPYKVEGLALAATPEKEARAGDTLRLAASLKVSGKPGPHMIRFEGIGPSGPDDVAAFRFWDKVWASDDATPRAVADWPLALNEKPGKWVLRATDVLSGASAESTVQVRPPR